METIAKFLKAIFFGEDGQVEQTTIAKFRKALLWILLGVGITIGALLYWADDEPEQEQVTTECINDYEG